MVFFFVFTGAGRGGKWQKKTFFIFRFGFEVPTKGFSN